MIIRTHKVSFSPDRKPMPSSLRVGFEGDNMVERIVLKLPDIAQSQTAQLMLGGKYADMVTLKKTDEDDRYYVDLTAELIGEAGSTECHVVINGSTGEVWHSDVLRLNVGDVSDDDVEIQQRFPTAVEQMRREMAELKALIDAITEPDVPFAGKKIVAVGDSIVQGTGDGAGGFLAALKTKYPSITTVNMGVGSTTFAVNNSVPANASEGCIFTRIDDIPSDADYIILQGGLNDFFHRDTYSVQFGEYVGNLNKYPIDAYYDGSYHQLYYGAEYGGVLSQVFYQETFCGAFEMSLVKIMTRFYDRKYVLLIPHDPTGSAELAKYLDAEARICRKYGFPCIDLRLSAGMPRIKAIAGGSDGASAYTVDEVHPNMAGYTEKYLPAIERWLTDGSVENSCGAVTLEQVLANTTVSPEKVAISVMGADGKKYTYTVYGTLTAVEEGEDAKYTNRVPISTDTDGSIYNGTGYKDDTRFSTTTGATKDLANGTVTGFIEVDGSIANTIRIAGYPWITSIDYNMICAYTADKTFLGAVTAKNGGTSTTGMVIFDSLSGDENIAQVVLKAGINIGFIRVGYYDAANADVTGANLIVTVNEEIA